MKLLQTNRPMRQALLGLALALSGAAQAADWQLTALTGLDKGYALNNQGLVVGQTDSRATSWRNGVAVTLAEPPGGASFGSVAIAVSPLGVMAGDGGNLRGANWTAGGLTPLGVLRDGVRTAAQGLNDFNSVGFTSYANDRTQATQWNLAGQPTLLTGLANTQHSRAYGINQAGQVVGWNGGEQFVDNFSRAVIWNQGQVSPLYTPGYSSSIARDINEHGEVAGSAYTVNTRPEHAVVWNTDGSLRTLDTPAGFDTSSAIRLNDQGWVLGEATRSADGLLSELMLWDDQDPAINLSRILADLNTAAGTHWRNWTGTDLDDQGQILVNAIDDDTGRSQAFILSMVSGTGQVPEPQSLALVLCGVALVWHSRRQRARQAGVPVNAAT